MSGYTRVTTRFFSMLNVFSKQVLQSFSYIPNDLCVCIRLFPIIRGVSVNNTIQLADISYKSYFIYSLHFQLLELLKMTIIYFLAPLVVD